LKRFSVQKSEWSNKREEDYKKECFNLVYEFGHKLIVEDDRVYLMMSEMKIEISNSLKFGTFWYETWLEIRKIYKLD